jgi:electron transport complex protein RnfB
VNASAESIDALLPQTQCTRCGYAGCRPYAEAIASGAADINQCPPGGQVTIDALARFLGRDSKPLNPANGVESAQMVALIDEERCIGCAKCLPACPVDAIVGAHRFMHTVLSAQCNGCELCLPPCPVDCISMVPARDVAGEALPRRDWNALRSEAGEHRRRYDAHRMRRERMQDDRERLLAARKQRAAAWHTS